MGFFDFFTDRTPAEPAEIRLVAFVSGKVQGVGFRWWCAGTAKPMGLTGYAENLDDGRVKVIADGRLLRSPGGYSARRRYRGPRG